MKDYFRTLGLCCFLCLPVFAADRYIPSNTQAPGQEPLSPEAAAAAMRLPEGFSATLFAGEPDVRQPIAMKLDDRGRVWVAESYSYKCKWNYKCKYEYEWKYKCKSTLNFNFKLNLNFNNNDYYLHVQY